MESASGATRQPVTEKLKSYYMDLRVHIGSNLLGKPVKVTASKALTLHNIIKECLNRKGMDIVGIVDCAAPTVLREIRQLQIQGELAEMDEGGLRHRERVTILPASEVETYDPKDPSLGREAGKGGGISHHVAYFPFLRQMEEFSKVISPYITNMELSTQRCGLRTRELYAVVEALGGVVFPAHAFTPHKSVYGRCTDRLSRLLPEGGVDKLPALELGLSADTDLADRIAELSGTTFLSNSDAHSLAKIGREYNEARLLAPTFKEVMLAMRREAGRAITINYGLDPKLGKYHRTHCESCGHICTETPPAFSCEKCGSRDITLGVLDRIVSIQDFPEPRHPEHRARYRYQIPLEFVPGVGKKVLDRLIGTFGSEMAVLHEASNESLRKVVGSQVAGRIIAAREGALRVQPGGGGKYGQVEKEVAERMEQLTFRF
ncbi:MAG: TIGR00375 family protein [Armatimonadetes bacterium]|nr:TIGR00375 family protein [Armatimonadota bacterium]